jgi:hypothetical protein
MRCRPQQKRECTSANMPLAASDVNDTMLWYALPSCGGMYELGPHAMDRKSCRTHTCMCALATCPLLATVAAAAAAAHADATRYAASSMTQKKVDNTYKVTVVLDMQVRLRTVHLPNT